MNVSHAVSALLVLATGASLAGPGARFQDDADIYRLRHLEYYAGLIEEFREAVGRYPLDDASDGPVRVVLAATPQALYATPTFDEPHTPVRDDVFFAELTRGLGRDVPERYDPQFVPDEAPVYYTYRVHDGTWSFTVHTHRPHPFAEALSEHAHRVTVGNAPVERPGVHVAAALFADEAFRAAADAEPRRPAFFRNREMDLEYDSRSR